MDLVRSGARLFFARIGSALIGFLGLVLFARYISPSQLGSFFLFEGLVGLLLIIADAGIRGGVEKRISEGNDAQKVVASGLLVALIPYLLVSVGVIVLRDALNGYLDARIAIFIPIAILTKQLLEFWTNVVKGELRVGETAPLRLLYQLSFVICALFLIYQWSSVEALVVAFLFGNIIGALYGIRISNVSIGFPSWEAIVSILSYARYNAISSFGGYLYGWIDILFIGWFLTSAAVSPYELAWRVTVMVGLLSTVVANTIFPQISSLQGDTSERRELISNATSVTLLFVIPAFGGAMVLSNEIMSVVFGDRYGHAGMVLVLLMLERVSHAIRIIAGRGLQAVNAPRFAAKATILAGLSNGILNILLIPRYGIEGAAVATLVSFSISTILHIYYVQKTVGYHLRWRDIQIYSVATVIMVIVLTSVSNIITIGSIPVLFGIIGGGAIVYFSILLTIKTTQVRLLTYSKRIVSQEE